LATTDMGQKLGVVPLCGGGSWVPIEHNVARAEAYLHAKFHLNPSSRLDTIHQCHIGQIILPTVAKKWQSPGFKARASGD